jgi:L-asparaginase
VFHPQAVRKHHTWRLDAFAAGDDGAVGHVVDGCLHRSQPWPEACALGLTCLPPPGTPWPRVEVVMNHAGADGRVVELLMADGVDGLVLAGTGNGTLSDPLARAARRAQAAGVVVWRASRCAAGGVVGGGPGDFYPAGALSPAQARVSLTLALLAQPSGTG